MRQPTPDLLPAMIRRGIPERTIRATMAPELQVTEALKAAAEVKESIVVLAGNAGVGKSLAACLWLFEQAKGAPECMRWVQSGDLARGYSYDAEAFEGITTVWALVIDDFGVEYLDSKDRFKVTLEEVLARRFGKMRRTMMTTNILDAGEFAERYGKRIASRIHEDGAFIVCGGPDLRRNGAP